MPIKIDRICPHCGKSFNVHVASRKCFCSPKCRKLANYERVKLKHVKNVKHISS